MLFLYGIIRDIILIQYNFPLFLTQKQKKFGVKRYLADVKLSYIMYKTLYQ